jgi:DNA-directed RNA polymerase specialized sigma24 family protein
VARESDADFSKTDLHSETSPATEFSGDRRSLHMTAEDRLEAFHQYRTLLLAIAYRMLGSSADAEDILQETFIRWQQAPAIDIESPRGLLVTILTRLAINHLSRHGSSGKNISVNGYRNRW